MKKNWIFTTMLAMIFAFGTAQAQSGSVGLGVRLNPDGAGLTGKFFFTKNWAIEGQLNASGGYGTWDDGPSMTGVALAEYHIICPDPSWRLFFGPGVHFGSWNRYYYSSGPDYYRNNYQSGPAEGIFGIDGILGIEYVFKHCPVGISADIKPAMNFTPDATNFPNNFFGLAGRFYFGQRITYAHHKPSVTAQ
jgi:hypothetical protein